VDDGAKKRPPPRREHSGLPSALEASRVAMKQLARLTGREADSVSALSRTDDGWRLEVEIVELERIPQTTSVLGTYQVDTDEHGNVTSYKRVRRYTRSQAGDR
jgi:hypothetical protein